MDKVETIEKKYWLTERHLGRGCILLSGQYVYVDKNFGYTMDNHIKRFIMDHEIVSHDLVNHNGLTTYTVIMRHRTKS